MSAVSSADGIGVSGKAVPPVPVRQSSVTDSASSACIVSKKLNVQLFKGHLFDAAQNQDKFIQEHVT